MSDSAAGDRGAAPRIAEELLSIRNIKIVYNNSIEAVRDVSLSVPRGGIVALLGSNCSATLPVTGARHRW
ncbi:MAG: hypothetical protein HLUCCA24_01730 [Rhodobacteraceae bacterium HLUCCA24]|nr:MAG: hypothetical protein HLUCCA24_01730 [Rhodobacteraceae bacterium HLUCCA24]